MANVKRQSSVTREQIIAARAAAGLTQEAAATLLGVSRRTMQLYESGTVAMRARDFSLLKPTINRG